jgi:hypothetical protein
LPFKILPAVAADALAACEVLRRSIAELCVVDHDNRTRPAGRQIRRARRLPDVERLATR